MSDLETEFRRSLIAQSLPIPDRVNWDWNYPGETFQVDFAYSELKIAIEIQGGTRINGVHVQPTGYAADRRKSNEAQLAGWIVLEFTDRHIRSGYAADAVRRALSKRYAEE